MATPNQRAIALLEALLNRTPSTEVRNRVLAAYGSPEEFIDSVYGQVRHRVKSHEALAPDGELTPTP